MNATITAAPLPTNFKGTPQQWLEAFLDRLEVSFDGNSFVISDIQPSGNQGPWLKNGTQWWVWNEATSQYEPLDVSASITNQIYIGDIANGPPDPAVYQLWLQLDGTQVNGLFFYAGTTAGWVEQANPLQPGAVTINMLAPQAPGSLITFDVNKNPTILPPGNPGTFLQSTGNGLTYSSVTATKGTPIFITPVVMVSAIGSVGADDWSTISTLLENGVPLSASAVILATNLINSNVNADPGLQMRANSASPTYTLAKVQGGASGGAFNQSIYPIAQASGILSFDWSADTAGNYGGSTITLVGYIA